MSANDQVRSKVNKGVCPNCSQSLYEDIKTVDGTGLYHCGTCGGLVGWCNRSSSVFIAREFDYCPGTVDLNDRMISCQKCGENHTKPSNGHMFFLH